MGPERSNYHKGSGAFASLINNTHNNFTERSTTPKWRSAIVQSTDMYFAVPQLISVAWYNLDMAWQPFVLYIYIYITIFSLILYSTVLSAPSWLFKQCYAFREKKSLNDAIRETNMASNSTHFPTSTRDIFLTKFIAKIFPMHYTCMLTRTPVLHPNKNDNNNISKNRNIHR